LLNIIFFERMIPIYWLPITWYRSFFSTIDFWQLRN